MCVEDLHWLQAKEESWSVPTQNEASETGRENWPIADRTTMAATETLTEKIFKIQI